MPFKPKARAAGLVSSLLLSMIVGRGTKTQRKRTLSLRISIYTAIDGNTDLGREFQLVLREGFRWVRFATYLRM